MIDSIQVTSRDNWFDPAVQFQVASGATLAEILDQAGVSRELQDHHGIAINGEIIPPENRRRIRPKPGTRERPVVITIHPPELHGGRKATTKNVLTIVASIALAASTAFIGAGGLGAVLGIAAIGPQTLGAAALASSFGLRGQGFKVNLA